MAWTLQPKSWMQVIRPNLYDIAYRRTGAYKGMGALGQSIMPGDGMDTSLLNLPMTGTYTANPLQTSATFAPAVPNPVLLWFQQNTTLAVIGGIAILALLAGGRRR